MTYRDSDALCLPARPPQHAAPVSLLRMRSADHLGVFGWLRRLTRQALRLFITVVAWATGLGLVIGSIVLVATVSAPRQAPSALNGQQNADSAVLRPPKGGAQGTADSRPGTVGHQGYRVVAAFSGQGNGTTGHFTVKARQRWQLRWTYRCAAKTSAAQADAEFMLLRANMATDQDTIKTTADEFAASGHGSVWLTPSSHQHYLMVISACSWHIQVVQAA
jgi:hypothetical protein